MKPEIRITECLDSCIDLYHQYLVRRDVIETTCQTIQTNHNGMGYIFHKSDRLHYSHERDYDFIAIHLTSTLEVEEIDFYRLADDMYLSNPSMIKKHCRAMGYKVEGNNIIINDQFSINV